MYPQRLKVVILEGGLGDMQLLSVVVFRFIVSGDFVATISH